MAKKRTKWPKKHTKGPKMQKYRLRNLNLPPKNYKIMFWPLTAETHQKHPKNGQKSGQILYSQKSEIKDQKCLKTYFLGLQEGVK